MAESLVGINILFFLIMGLMALARPAGITAYFGLSELPPAMRNEVRAVYGGFGVAVAGLLMAGLMYPDLRFGILLTVGVALLGMASGRLISFAFDRTLGFYPRLFLAVEIGLGGSLLFAMKTT